MTHIRSRLLLAATFASLSMTSLSEAQGGGAASRPRDGQRPAGAMRRGGDAPGPEGAAGPRREQAGGRGHPARMVLRLRQQLQLTDEQVQKLQALQDAPAPRMNEADMLRARADLLEATQGDGNAARARAALDRLSALRNERLIAGLRQRQEARAVLTSAQKTRLDNLRSDLRRRGVARGMGRGDRALRGRGMGRGMGPATGRGMRSGMRPGMGPGMRPGMRPGMGPGPRRGMGPGAPVPPAPRPPEGER